MNNLRAAYMMNKEADVENQTRSSQINEFIALITDFKAGKVQQEDVKNEIEGLKFVINTLKTASENSKELQPDIEDFEIKFERLMELFDLLPTELDNIAIYIGENDEQSLDESIEKMKNYTDEIMEISEDFAKVEAEQPVYSKSMFIDGLLRIGHGCVEGRYTLENLSKPYNAVRALMEDVFAQMQPYADLPKDTKAFEKNYPKTIELMNDCLSALDEIGQIIEAGENGDKKALLPLLDRIQKSSDEMNKIQLEIEKEVEKIAEENSKRVCPHCGDKTSKAEKFCQSCNKVLPPLPDSYAELQGKISFMEGGDAMVMMADGTSQSIPPDHKMVSPNVLKIYEAALQVGRGESTKEEFEGVLNWYENLLTRTQKEAKNVKSPENADEKSMEIFQRTFELLMAGIEESFEGLNELRNYFEEDNLDHLVNGVNRLMDAGEKLFQAQALPKENKEVKETTE